ncbi:hypothetical protein KXD93_27210 [Mucilaginibacter sp. BJC16-A38]|uniref:hypothetical protein n=1 Tax=Mucilaginibacter phenanthrenivorans TaxID=1234842 RepID=UPI002157978E|nr:hypothetical protein [Mucilaginibacter phenanthrenivorans]MCR8561372.1 hypothetical protein [Mucilaginibacter phenanthrenivorans]
MEKLIKAGRIFYGIMIAGLGVQQIFYADFRPVIFPPWGASVPGIAFWAYLFTVVLIAAGICIIIDKWAREVSLILGGLFLLLILLCQAPYELIMDPYKDHLGSWTNALKELVLAGGAFAVAGTYPVSEADDQKTPSLIWLLEKLIPFGGTFLSITMILFGVAHFLYPTFVAPLVPAWIPSHLFWTYFAGVALIAAGVGIILKIQLKLAALLLGAMIFIWLLVLHIPRTIADPYGDKGNELTSVFEALGFSGIAFIVAFGYHKKKKAN